MQSPARIPRLLLVTGALFAVVFALSFVPRAARADDDNDPVALKKRIAELEAKVASLESQIQSAGIGDLSPADKEKFSRYLETLSPGQRRIVQEQLNAMPVAQRNQMMRSVPDIAPAAIGVAKKRNQAMEILEELRLIDSACDQYAIETNKTSGMHPTFGDLKNYLKTGTTLYNTGADIFGNTYGPFTVDSIPKVSEAAFDALSDVAGPSFWSPYR